MSDIAAALERLQVRFRARAAEDLDNIQRWSGDLAAHGEDLRLLAATPRRLGRHPGFHHLSDVAAAAEDAFITAAPDRSHGARPRH